MAELEIVRYSPEMKREWDEFIDRSKNGTFLLKRDYMDYHSDRFSDYSLLFKKGNSIQAVMPACLVRDCLVSHAGLTYGGYIMSRKTTTEETLQYFCLLKDFLKIRGFGEIIYKPTPHIYHTLPSEEDLYAIFRLDARLTARNVSAAILMSNRIPFRDIRKSGIRKASSCGIYIRETSDYSSFWKILNDNLGSKYGASPVHTLDEITMLANLFQKDIKLYMAYDSDETPLGGTVVFITPTVVHTQYISASPQGKSCGALDLLFDRLINDVFPCHRYFDFGTSNENGGRVLNESLIYQKEGFGARAICYDTYSIKI